MKKFLKSLPKIKITADLTKSLPETPGVYAYFDKTNVLYVGKAINLKRRVSSYFDLELDIKTAKMIKEATYISTIKVASELEALLLEAKLIREYLPHYNIISKDDKHPLYIRITKEDCPRVLTARKIAENEKNIAFYGPFPSSKSVYMVLKMIRRIFPFSDHPITKRPCLYSHIGLCNPCPSEIKNIKDTNRQTKLVKTYRKNIKMIEDILDGRIEKVEKGLEKEMQSFSKQEKYEEAGKVKNQLEHLKYITRPQIPTDYYIKNPNLLEDTRKRELKELKKIINQAKIPISDLTRIECFDIAHLAGTNATASMVTFIDAEADKSLYRHFKIKKIKTNDDYSSMREVAERRKKNFENWGKPNLIIVDGGIGQISSFKEKIQDIPIVGIAKHPDRLIVNNKKIRLTGSPLNLVSRIRDEAHRFTRVYHHKLVSRTLTSQ